MIITKQDCERKEAYLVQELLANLHRTWGPCICTALACAPLYWENDVAARIAVAITKSIANPTKANVARHLGFPEAMWLWNYDFKGGWDSETAMFIAEWEAESLLPRYRSKKLSEVLGKSYTEAFNHPERVSKIATETISKLQQFV